MGSIEKTLKDEIRKIAKREVTQEIRKLRSDNTKFRKALVAMKKEMAACAKASKAAAKAATSTVTASSVESEENAASAKIRPTAKTIRTLRKKFGFSQGEFAKMLDASVPSIVKWENATGKLSLRAGTLAKFAAIMGLGKREAHQMYQEMTGSSAKKAPGKPGPKTKAKPEAVKKTGKRGRPAKDAVKTSAQKVVKKAKRGRKPGRKPAAKKA